MTGAAGAGLVVFMGGELIEPQHQKHPEGHADYHHGSGEKSVAGDSLCRLEPRQQQGEGAGCQHHAGGKAQHAVFYPLRNRAQKKGGQGAKCGGGKAGQATDKAVANARADVAGGQHHQALQQQQHDGRQSNEQADGDHRACPQLLAQLG